jgi:hypothetical protein
VLAGVSSSAPPDDDDLGTGGAGCTLLSTAAILGLAATGSSETIEVVPAPAQAGASPTGEFRGLEVLSCLKAASSKASVQGFAQRAALVGILGVA